MARVIALVVLGASVLGSIAAQAEPVKVWELTGLKAPESALPDPSGEVLYVSNIDGSPVEKDGNGSISKVSPDGKMMEPSWATGLDAPKGMAISGGRWLAQPAASRPCRPDWNRTAWSRSNRCAPGCAS